MPAPLVSIVIPAFNHEKFVNLALQSVLEQSWSPVEVAVVDDGSTDGSWNALARWKDDPRVRLFRQGNQGAHAAINRGLAEARGEYLAILDSDDIYPPERLALLVDQARTMDGPAFIFTGLEFIQEDGEILPKFHDRVKYYDNLLERTCGLAIEDAFLAGNPAMTTSNFFMSRSAWEAVGPFRSLRYTHDWDWALRACGRVEMAWLKAPCLKYRVHGGSTLAEGDAWRHISENAFLFASHLRRKGLGKGLDAGSLMRRFCTILLNNQSFLPTAALLFLLLMNDAGDEAGEEALESQLAGDMPARLAEIYGQSGLCNECMLSAAHLDDRLSRRPVEQVLDMLRRACGLKVLK